MEQYIEKITTIINDKPRTQYKCKKCDKICSDITKIKTHLNSKKPCDVELKMLALINENNISDNNEYQCKKCKKYSTKTRAEFYKHITRKQSCVSEEEIIDDRTIIYKDGKSYVKSHDGKRNMPICIECIKEKIITYGSLCEKHCGNKKKIKTCKYENEDCDKNATHEGYCFDHYKSIDKDNKKFQCPKCFNIFWDNAKLKKHLDTIDCLKKIEEDEKYEGYKIYIDGNLRYKCFCGKIFDLHGLKRHFEIKKSCIEEKEIKERFKDNLIYDENNKSRYLCFFCGMLCDDRTMLTRHLNRKISCNPMYVTEYKDGNKIIYKGNNKYKVTDGSINLLCKNNNCYLCAANGGYCVSHGGTHKKYYCEFVDEDGTKCDKLYKVYIDGIKYCIFHGGQPKLKECVYDDCDKLIHSATYCSKHKINKKISDKEQQKKYHQKNYKKNIAKNFVNGSKNSDKKSNRNYNHKDFITQSYINALIEMSDYKCYWCKRTIHKNIGNCDLDQISIDRKDNSLPHIINNIVISCLFCNRGRNKSTTEYWEKYLDVLINKSTHGHSDQKYDDYWAANMASRLSQYDKKNNRENNITTEWIKEQFKNNNKSYYTGIPMFPSKTPHYPFQPSIDRIDNTKGHTQDNCVLCCFAENYGRNNVPFDEFKEWINTNFNCSKPILQMMNQELEN